MKPGAFHTLLPLSAGPGVILGTATYIAPEQARGKPVDERAEIWAFGLILYELLTGRYPVGMISKSLRA